MRSDRVLLRRLLQNLVSNALRYTQRGGVVVGCRPRGGRVEVQVWDTGPGIAEQHRKVIFDEFRGLDRPSPWGEKGLGLGLSICDRIARVLQLDLSLRSDVGQGSMFSVQLEATAEAVRGTGTAGEPAPASPASLVGGTVLCVDNETAILDGMQTLLERWGVRVLRASTAEEARRAFTQHSPDVVLADYRLGDDSCDGLELLQSLRVGGVSHAPAALVTADHGAEVAERARVLGYKVLRKPVKPAALRGLLGALLATGEPRLVEFFGRRLDAGAVHGEASCRKHGLRARRHTELAQDRRDVCFHRRFRHVEVVGDLLVEQARAQHAEHAELLRRQVGDAVRDLEFFDGSGRSAWRLVARRRVDFSGQHRLDGLADLAGLRRLRDEPLRAEAQRRGDGLRVVVGGNDDDGQLGPAAAHVRERIEAVRTRHVEVEQQQVRAGIRFGGGEHRCHGIRLDESDAAIETADRGLHRFAKQRMVVGDDDLT